MCTVTILPNLLLFSEVCFTQNYRYAASILLSGKLFLFSPTGPLRTHVSFFVQQSRTEKQTVNAASVQKGVRGSFVAKTNQITSKNCQQQSQYGHISFTIQF